MNRLASTAFRFAVCAILLFSGMSRIRAQEPASAPKQEPAKQEPDKQSAKQDATKDDKDDEDDPGGGEQHDHSPPAAMAFGELMISGSSEIGASTAAASA